MREMKEMRATLEEINQFPLNPNGYTVDSEVFASPSNWGKKRITAPVRSGNLK